MILTRRSLLAGLGAVLAAPAIIRTGLMPVKAWVEPASAFSPYMGYDSLCYRAGEQIWAGDLVYIGRDDRLYCMRHDTRAPWKGVSSVTRSENMPIPAASIVDFGDWREA